MTKLVYRGVVHDDTLKPAPGKPNSGNLNGSGRIKLFYRGFETLRTQVAAPGRHLQSKGLRYRGYSLT